MRTGVRLGVDVGTVRVGVAVSDPDGVIATPVRTLDRGTGDLAELVALVGDRKAIEVVVGLPTTLAGRSGPAAEAVQAYAEGLAATLDIPVRLVDERFSTVEAARDLRTSGVGSRKGRRVIDQAAAVIILQGALDAERQSGTAPGRVVIGTRRDEDPSTSRATEEAKND